jgi:hypothetical protein
MSSHYLGQNKSGLLTPRNPADRKIMVAETTHIYVRLPVELKREIDALGGPRERSAFFAAAAEQELRRRKLAALRASQREDPNCVEDHPYIN